MELIKAYLKKTCVTSEEFKRQVDGLITIYYQRMAHEIKSKADYWKFEKSVEQVLTEFFEGMIPEYYFFEVTYQPMLFDQTDRFIWSVVDIQGNPVNLFKNHQYNETQVNAKKENYLPGVYVDMANEYNRRIPWR